MAATRGAPGRSAGDLHISTAAPCSLSTSARVPAATRLSVTAGGLRDCADGRVSRGFFLRLHLGLGYGSLTGSGSYSGTATIAGSGVSVGVALGGGVAENLALYGTIFMSSFGNADSGSNTGTDASLGGYAVGVVYYFMPINVYVSGAGGVAGMGRFDSQGKLIDSSNIGLGFDGIVGKEWRVSRHWGLGKSYDGLPSSESGPLDQILAKLASVGTTMS
jgi:hypothetical protein